MAPCQTSVDGVLAVFINVRAIIGCGHVLRALFEVCEVLFWQQSYYAAYSRARVNRGAQLIQANTVHVHRHVNTFFKIAENREVSLLVSKFFATSEEDASDV